MKQIIVLGSVALALLLFVACGSSSNKSENQMKSGESMGQGSMEQGTMGQQMKSDKEWVREQPIDVKALDMNQDGYVYQDQMDWNVIADEEGKCPECGMILKKVTIAEASKNLEDNGYTTK